MYEKKVKPIGYYIASGYMGWVPWYRIYMLFATEQEYLEYLKGE